MRQRISTDPLQNQNRFPKKKTLTQLHYDRFGKIYLFSSVISFLLGFLQLFLFDFTDKTIEPLKYCGLIMITAAAFMLGWAVHFIDKSDDEKRQLKKP